MAVERRGCRPVTAGGGEARAASDRRSTPRRDEK